MDVGASCCCWTIEAAGGAVAVGDTTKSVNSKNSSLLASALPAAAPVVVEPGLEASSDGAPWESGAGGAVANRSGVVAAPVVSDEGRTAGRLSGGGDAAGGAAFDPKASNAGNAATKSAAAAGPGLGGSCAGAGAVAVRWGVAGAAGWAGGHTHTS